MAMKYAHIILILTALTLTGCASSPDPLVEARKEREQLYKEMMADASADEVGEDNEFSPVLKTRSAELSIEEEIEDELLR